MVADLSHHVTFAVHYVFLGNSGKLKAECDSSSVSQPLHLWLMLILLLMCMQRENGRRGISVMGCSSWWSRCCCRVAAA
jgi:hypothetical protein